jgi:hypothetical protein
MTCTYGALDTGAAMEYLNGLTGYEQSGRLEQLALEPTARLAEAMGNPQALSAAAGRRGLAIATGSPHLIGPLWAAVLEYPAGVLR